MHAGARGISCRLAQGAEESCIEVGDTGDLVIEDRRAVGDGAATLAERTWLLRANERGTGSLAARVTELAVVDGG